MKRRDVLGAAAVMAAGGWPAVRGQTIGKNMRLLLGFPPGGTADVIARALADRLRGSYANVVVIEHKPGARGVPVVSALRSSEPDGSTVMLAPHSVMTLWPHVYRKLPYDAMRDLRPGAMVAALEFALAVNPALPASNLVEFLAWAKRTPERALYGTLGPGSSPEFLGYQLGQDAGTRLTPVPYRGSAPGVVDLLGGQTPAWIGPLGDIAQHHATGKARILATSGLERSRFLPNVPTFAELGYPRVHLEERWGVFLRTDTSTPIADALNKAVLEAVHTPEFRNTLDQINYEARANGPAEFQAIIRREHDRWRAIVAASGFNPTE